DLDVPQPLSLVPPLTVQLTNTDGRCWEATYSFPSDVAASQFTGKADPTPLPRATRTPGPTTPTAHRAATPAATGTAHPTPRPTFTSTGGGGGGGGCCKHCSTGKPCGNSCISISFTCHQPPGCACY